MVPEVATVGAAVTGVEAFVPTWVTGSLHIGVVLSGVLGMRCL